MDDLCLPRIRSPLYGAVREKEAGDLGLDRLVSLQIFISITYKDQIPHTTTIWNRWL